MAGSSDLGRRSSASSRSTPDVKAKLDGLTISAGRAVDGGGVLNAGGTDNPVCSIIGNNADGGSGGGVYNTGSMTIEHSVVSSNTGQGGGGAQNDYGTLTIVDSIFIQNSGGRGRSSKW